MNTSAPPAATAAGGEEQREAPLPSIVLTSAPSGGESGGFAFQPYGSHEFGGGGQPAEIAANSSAPSAFHPPAASAPSTVLFQPAVPHSSAVVYATEPSDRLGGVHKPTPMLIDPQLSALPEMAAMQPFAPPASFATPDGPLGFQPVAMEPTDSRLFYAAPMNPSSAGIDASALHEFLPQVAVFLPAGHPPAAAAHAPLIAAPPAARFVPTSSTAAAHYPPATRAAAPSAASGQPADGEAPPKKKFISPFSPEATVPLPSQLDELGNMGTTVWRRNERERYRVRCVNNGYSELRNHLPLTEYEKRLSKVDTLRLAILYIQHLELLIQNITHELDCQCFANFTTDSS